MKKQFDRTTGRVLGKAKILANTEENAWLDALHDIRRDGEFAGFAVALAEMYRLLPGGCNPTGVCEVARAAGLTLTKAKRVGVSAYDLEGLRRAGVPRGKPTEKKT